MSSYARPIQELIDAFGRLPGIGPKSAQRIALHMVSSDPSNSERLARTIVDARSRIRFCDRCFNLSENVLCEICSNPRRDDSVLCVVEEASDVAAVERTHTFAGRYHVLGGAIDHLRGIGPDKLRIRQLIERLAEGPIVEVILCTNPSIEGDATALYLSKVLTAPGITVSRVASGLPVGGDLEYADELTLGRALEGRRAITSPDSSD